MMTVDWEGSNLTDANISAMKSLRNDYPQVPILHYMNAAYFFKPDIKPSEAIETIKETLIATDEIGLHIHGWKNLFEASGVTHKIEPDWRINGMKLSEKECASDCGHSIPITAFNEEELIKVITKSNEILMSYGFPKPVSFRSGGWVMSLALLNALAKTGFTNISAAVPPIYLDEKLNNYKLFPWLSSYYPEITPMSEPFIWESGENKIWELTDNGCLADYVNDGQIVYNVLEHIKMLENTDKTSDLLVIGFHQETAATYLPDVRKALDKISEIEKKSKVKIRFITSPLTNNLEEILPLIPEKKLPPKNDSLFGGEIN